MPNIRLFPGPASNTPVKVSGRTYTPVQGVAMDVPDFDANMLQAHGYTAVGEVGTTALRPTGANVYRGRTFVDTTVGAMIVYDGTVWRNPATGAAV